MKKNVLLISTFLIIVFTASSQKIYAQKIKAELISISYYSKSPDCNSTGTILVRIKFKVMFTNLKKIIMSNKYKSGVRVNTEIQKIDKSGYLVYDFCIEEGKSEEFETVFKTETGQNSNSITIKVNTENSKIISGTPAKTYKL